jgi:hypothetical protein
MKTVRNEVRSYYYHYVNKLMVQVWLYETVFIKYTGAIT